MRINRKQTYSALAGVGILLGAAGIASAATGTTSPTQQTTTAAVTVADARPADGQDVGDQNEVEGQDEVGDQNEVEGQDEAGDQNEVEGQDEADAQDETSYTSSITVADDTEASSEADEQNQLATLATVTADQAGAAAVAAQPGTVTGVQLENENGNVVYSVAVDTVNGSVEVKVDAGNATVLATDTGDGDGEHHDKADQSNDEAPGVEAADD